VGRHLIAERLASQLLAGPPADSALDVVERLLAVQAQDPRGFRLAVRARTAGLAAADVDRALTVDRSLVVTWLNRGTLHIVTAEDYWWLHALTTPQTLVGNARRLAQEGVSPEEADRGVHVVERSLAGGPLTRVELRDRIAAAGVRVQGQALVHILMLANLRGVAVRGPMSGGQHAYVLVRDWVGRPPPGPDRDGALAELARRYLAGHGPAGERDLARWSGLPLRDVRRGLSAIAGDLDERGDGLVALAACHADVDLPPPRLLGAFDPLLLGWVSREPILGRHEQGVVVGGLFRPFALARGTAVATWSMPKGHVELAPFGRLPSQDAAALRREAEDVERFLS
jgi:hypothetical protein